MAMSEREFLEMTKNRKPFVRDKRNPNRIMPSPKETNKEPVEPVKKKGRSKYGNHRIEVDGIKYDSKLEYERHQQLKMFELAGIISGLRFHDKQDIVVLGENPRITYEPDFFYIDEDGQATIEDTKGTNTKEFVVKKKIVLNMMNRGELELRFKIVKKQKGTFVVTESYDFKEKK